MKIPFLEEMINQIAGEVKESRFTIPITLLLGLFMIKDLGKLYIVKYFQRYLFLLVPMVITYRLITRSDYEPTILSQIVSTIQSINHPFIRRLFGDFIGAFILCRGLSLILGILDVQIVELKNVLIQEVFQTLQYIPFVKSMLDKEKIKAEENFEKDLKSKSRIIGTMNKILPTQGIPRTEVIKLMKEVIRKETETWKNGKVSGSVYYDWKFEKDSHLELLNTAFGLYSITNPLHPDIWPSAMKYESEIISMTASLVNGGNDIICGSTTSGGTESIILAIKAYRDYYRQKYGIQYPEIVAGTSAHAAVDKACDMLGIRLIKVSIDPITYKVNTREVKRVISSNTILIYSSAPTYPQGVIDPIKTLGKLAKNYDIGLHVDCCLGGFVLPFAKKLGYDIPDFDFTVPGVTSMSMDTHKYGYTLKGSSVILYATKELRQAQYFCYADWSGGLYTTPTIAGSRSGGVIAQCWASLITLGEEGYLKLTKNILQSTKLLAEGISSIDGLKVIGNAEVMIVCFVGVSGLNIYSVVDTMAKKGWSLSSHQNPPCAHICCTAAHVGNENKLLSDLRVSVEEVKSDPNKKSGKAAIYGMTSSLPPGPVNDILKIYNDVVLKV